ncbi:aminopeptidase N-like [Musca domestica]|uniref:Aminopeptidase n=1 Tax=Musca domestica TaxID=7370 RepID=A0A1I8N5N4_MUSDO|nr:aminopeptidase N-like [Musca domestica]XP_058986517.1 aminopeptidase N-like [Musca domestica]
MENRLWLTLGISLMAMLALTNAYTHYRLPTAIKPDRYKLKVITHLENPANLTFNGQVSIRFNVLEETNNITLHAQNLTIDENRIQLKSYGDKKYRLCKESVQTVTEQDYYIIRLCQPLEKGQMYKLKLYFSGILSEKLHGYYRSSYVAKETNETRWLSVTQFEPASARAAFPCFDEPNYKAKFIIWMGHHKSLTALSNMPLEKQMPVNGLTDFIWSVFEESVPMSTYLVAYTVNDFKYKESKVEGSDVVFRTWARGDYINQCDYAAEVGPNVLKYYEEVFGIPFPLKKVDEIAIPDFSAGAMENWGLVTYRETALLFAPNVSSESNKQRIAEVIAHELAHQWFGNLVTMKWWTDLWLNEGFATYIASLGLKNLNPEWDSYNADSLDNSLSIFRRDAQLSSHPISQPILNTSQIGERFDSISYKKGSAVLRMLHMLLGQEGFFEGVRDYLMKHKYGNAEQDDLWAAFTEKAHKFDRIEPKYDMKVIMDSWTLQTGYPLVRVNRNYETGAIEISQHRYLENNTISEEEAKKCWWVPLSYTTPNELDFENTSPKVWMECDESGKSVPLKLENVVGPQDWIIFNIQLSGVYRVMYDMDNWRLLNATLNSDKFSSINVMNRAHLIDDVISFAWSGYHDYDITFDVLEYLTKEREYLPWKAALDGLSSVIRLLRPFTEQHDYFKTYLRYIIEPIYYHVEGLNNSLEATKTHSGILLKSLVTGWACRIELEDCVQTAVNYFQQWKQTKNPDEENQIPADLRPTVYCTAIRHGDKDDWQFLWQRYRASNVATEKRTIIVSLGCSRNEKVLRDYIDLTFDKAEYIRTQDVTFAFSSIARSEVGAPIARDYFAQNLAALHNFFGPQSTDLGRLLSSLSSQIISTEDFEKITQLIDSNKEYFKKAEKSVQSAYETINFNIQWIGRNVQDMKSRLADRLSLMGLLKTHVDA